MIKDLSDNHLFNNYPCEAEDAKIESLRQKLATLKTELKSIGNAIDDPRTDLTMTMSEVILEYKQQLSDSQKQVTVLRDAILYVYEHYGKSSFDWCYLEKALAATEQKL